MSLKHEFSEFKVSLDNSKEFVLFSRHEHGNLPICLQRQGKSIRFSIQGITGNKIYRNGSQLLTALYGHKVSMPVDRYFRIGRYRKPEMATGLLSLLDVKVESSPIIVHGVSGYRRTTEISVDGERDPIVVELRERLQEDLGSLEGWEGVTAFEKGFESELRAFERQLGIDLTEKSPYGGRRADEVRKLLWKGFAGKMLSQGYDPDDVLQEVYRGLLVRNKGTCPFDRDKSTLGHYVHMVISCVLTNYHRKQRKRLDKNKMLLEDGKDIGQWGTCELGHGTEMREVMMIGELRGYLEKRGGNGPDARVGREILPLLSAGYRRADIVRETGYKPSLVSRALAWIRGQTARWAVVNGYGGSIPAKWRAKV